jgi:Transposase DDE domain
MTILIMFHHLRFRDFKTFYTGYVQSHWRHAFPGLTSYSRCIAIIKQAIFPMTLFTYLNSGKRTGIYYIDSSCLPVCHLKRSRRHQTFDQIAAYGRTSVGWFFGLKLHSVINDRGELIAFKITQGNRHDGQQAPALFKQLQGIAFGDKGYLGKKIVDELLARGLKLMTRTRKNMKSVQLTGYEQQLLNHRGIVETVIGHLKHHYQVWHTRHRSTLNAMTHLISAVAAYAITPLKISAIRLLANS